MSKPKLQARLAALSFSEKIKILEKLRDREKAIAAVGLRRESQADAPNASVKAFCRTVRQRSRTNKAAMHLLDREALTGKVVGTLREELDSMIRCIYLLSIKDRQRRHHLVEQFLNGQRWPVTDARMVGLANQLHGWDQSVYKFGCAFIHLSKYHDPDEDPFASLTSEERKQIADHLSYYHGFHMDTDTTFNDVAPILPMVFEKIAGNLECYVRELENDSDLDG
jgi:hypothetical protein